MKILIAISIVLSVATNTCAQKYETYQKTENVTFGYKWATAKNENRETVPALLLSVKNENGFPIKYTMSVDMYYEGILRESADLVNCVEANKTRMGKLNGVFLIPEKFTAEQIKNKDFKLELNEISVSKTESCKEETSEEETIE
jgi:hypothetical protein